MKTAAHHARETFRHHGGMLRTTEALRSGIHRRTLYAMRDAGEIETLGRGLFRLRALSPLADPDLVTVAKRIPHGIVCLISALAFHELTTQIPHVVHLALPRTARHPQVKYPPLRIYWFSAEAYKAGVESHTIDHIPVRVYDPEKTLADCFKYRNKVGMEVFLEALHAYRRRRKSNLQKVLEYAKVCRVERLLRPYLEAIV